MRWRRIRSVLIGALAVLVAAPVAQAVVTPTKVLGGEGDQFYPFASDAFLTFSDWQGGRDIAMAERRATGFTFRMNETGTSGEAGGIDPGTDTAIFQQFKDRSSVIYLFDLGDRERRLAPGVNSSSWEWAPRISNRYISVFRNREAAGVDYVDLLLYRRDTKVLRRVATFKWKRYESNDSLFLANGGVTDDYAFWGACTASDGDCDVFVYDISARTTKDVTGGGDKQEYGIAVDANGDVYFTRSGANCGANVAVWRLDAEHLAATPTKVAALPDGYDTGYVASVALNGDTGRIDYYFERGSCQNWNSDIFVASGVDPL